MQLPNQLGPYQLDAFETVTGYVGGEDPDVPALDPYAHAGKTPLQALEAAVLPALSRPPCLVVFSGGRDSSAVLAVATAVARRSGLPDPVPSTNRFRGSPATKETEWQELVVRHLGLTDWHVLDWDDELDVIGPVAEQVLSRWGPVYPHNAHFGIPLLRAAPGGSALTGVGGDQIFQAGQFLRLARLLSFEARPRLQDWRTIAGAVAPRSVRRHRWQKGLTTLPWLTDAANRRLGETMTRDLAIDPIWFASTVRGPIWRDRSRVAAQQTLRALCADIDVTMSHPLEDPGFLAALASALPRTGYRTRDQAMTALFGHLLPATLLQRHTKAAFNEAFFNAPSREFAETWDGAGLDPALVDPKQLRETWLADSVDARSLSALQGAWAARRIARQSLAADHTEA